MNRSGALKKNNNKKKHRQHKRAKNLSDLTLLRALKGSFVYESVKQICSDALRLSSVSWKGLLRPLCHSSFQLSVVSETKAHCQKVNHHTAL